MQPMHPRGMVAGTRQLIIHRFGPTCHLPHFACKRSDRPETKYYSLQHTFIPS